MTMLEFELSERFFSAWSGGEGVALGYGDDAALLDLGPGLAMCLDTLVEGVHFPVDTPADAVGHKALAVNLSDLAAMGAEPGWALLGLTLPDNSAAWVAGFAQGMRALAERTGVALIGGDTTRGPRTITVQLTGCVAPDLALRRSGARVGDEIYVSGYLGDAALGLRLWQAGERAGPAVGRLLRPEPRLALGRALRGLATAGVDVSDGLAADLSHILSASGVGGVLDVERLPLSPALLGRVGRVEAEALALTGGDDYELCFTAPPEAAEVLRKVSEQLALPITRIGRIEGGGALRVLRQGRPIRLDRLGYQHFAGAGGSDEA